MVSAVVEQVAEDRPQELRLRMPALAQLGELFGRIPELEDLGDFWRHFAAAGAIVLCLQIEYLDLAPRLAIDPGPSLLAERPLVDQRLQPPRRLEVFMPGIVGQGVGHGLDHMRHGIQTDHVGGAIGCRLRPADRRTGQRVHFVKAELESLGVVHGRKDREHTNPVADEVWRIAGVDHAFSQYGSQECFKLFKYLPVSLQARDEFCKMHVARRIEEMHAAETMVQRRFQHIGQGIDRQAGGVGGEDRVWGHVGRNLRVQILLPVQPLGDGLDDQVAVVKQVQMLIVIRGRNRRRAILCCQRCRRELGKICDCLERDLIGIAILGGQVEQHRFDARIGQMRGDLRTHHAGTQHRRTTYK